MSVTVAPLGRGQVILIRLPISSCEYTALIKVAQQVHLLERS